MTHRDTLTYGPRRRAPAPGRALGPGGGHAARSGSEARSAAGRDSGTGGEPSGRERYRGTTGTTRPAPTTTAASSGWCGPRSAPVR
ncbi:predicted protein [Streptomyces viridochromogenes DSM 40736]|uniref:Predicted protein n=1 Tax=Streptomyces viridochromogenes (strain DSM 40736 / JCM 4977 / BCRC 1201 / Tue 494) TaxID=591159 RepID=D9X107_STRVT|nr:predicted protein [Streptomyces viridochromogenes DSM 40736]